MTMNNQLSLINVEGEEERQIIFDPIEHAYTDTKGNKYTSTTQVIDKYCEKFDSVNQAIAYAKKHGKTAIYWLDVWEQDKKTGIDRGNEHHDYLEDSVNKINGEYGNANVANTVYELKNHFKVGNINLVALQNSGLQNTHTVIYNRLVELIYAGYSLYAEKIVYWAELLVTGKIDLMAIKGTEFKIIDWKTNKDELMFISGYYKKVDRIVTNIWINQDKRLKYPLHHLQDCKGIKYILQLSLYARMMELFGYVCTGLELYHIRDIGITRYNLEYKKNDVELMCRHNAQIKTTPKFGII